MEECAKKLQFPTGTPRQGPTVTLTSPMTTRQLVCDLGGGLYEQTLGRCRHVWPHAAGVDCSWYIHADRACPLRKCGSREFWIISGGRVRRHWKEVTRSHC